ncbi:unnamed protein product [Fraxinus pennsylvanica]|uniref:Uncharacterized protein n=1 Tax=Fraxinus pennsylvanica TaxID=56036 RepID=A0AAD1Z4G3_9LAMI|nr:unnamed protein product [Fraxinus pennsylvanica]
MAHSHLEYSSSRTRANRRDLLGHLDEPVVPIQGIVDPLIAETLGVREALSWIKSKFIGVQTIEMDALLVYSALLNDGVDNSYLVNELTGVDSFGGDEKFLLVAISIVEVEEWNLARRFWWWMFNQLLILSFNSNPSVGYFSSPKTGKLFANKEHIGFSNVNDYPPSDTAILSENNLKDEEKIERLEIIGVGDPCGQGLGFSYVRVTPKASISNATVKKKTVVGKGSTVTRTDVDLCRLSTEAAKELSSFQFNEEACSPFVKKRQAVVPASGFSFTAQQIWKIIKENKDLDLPAHKVMVTTVHCEEIANEFFFSFIANECQALGGSSAQSLMFV